MKKLKLMFSLLSMACCISLFAQQTEGTQRRFVRPEPIVSPEFGDGTITFRLKSPYAQKVTFNGSWMSMFESKEMKKTEKGIWELTIPTPAPELYQYTFNVDGVSIPDPNNFNQVRDGAGYRTFLFVRGDKVKPYDLTATKHGKLEKVWYNSSVYGKQRRISVYLPHGYEKSKEIYPVFYLQHGGGGDEEAWPTLGRACEIMDYMIENGLCKPMIVVMPNCNPEVAAASEVAMPTKWPENMQDPNFMEGISYVKSIYTDIIPFVESTYKVKTGKANRAIAGLSMGGIYTLNVTQQRPDLFDYIGVLSMGTTPEKKAIDQLTPIKNAGYKLYFVGCGKSDIAYGNVERLLAGLNELKMPYVNYDDVPGHQWETWRKCLLKFAPMLFK